MDIAESTESAEAPAPAPVRWPRRINGRIRSAVTVPRLLLLLIAAAAATGYAWSLDTSGLETFYAAGVRSMSESWHAFFYDAFDPHATITLDKLPGAFWIQALFVRCFGYSVWAMVLPQVIESTLTVLVLYRAVRRTAGSAAALTAAAILAASPVTVGSTRGNLSEPLYLLCIVLAADAVLRAITTGRDRSWIVAGLWVAAGFQAKMTEAWLTLPVFALVFILAAPTGRWRTALRAAVWAAATAAVSLVWVFAFALTPAADRPYADGSTTDSIFAQVFVYNGTLRFGSTDYLKPLAAPSPLAEAVYIDNLHRPGVLAATEITHPAWDRLLAGTLAPDCVWFLLSAVGGAVAVLLSRRGAGRGDPVRAATVLWSVWLLGYGVAFSSAHLIQGYYLATLIPAIAALAGTGCWVLWRAARAGSRRSALALGLLTAGQAGWAAWLVRDALPWLSGLILAASAVAVLTVAVYALVPARRARGWTAGGRRLVAGACTVALFTGAIGAAVWLEQRAGGPFDAALSDQGTVARRSASFEADLAGVQGGYGGTVHGQYVSGQWASLMSQGARTQERLDREGKDVLFFSSAEAADAIMFGQTSIVPIGGFTGDVPSPSVAQIDALIQADEIVEAIVPDDEVLTGNDPRIKSIAKECGPGMAEGDLVIYLCMAHSGTNEF